VNNANRVPEFLEGASEASNQLMNYVQSLSPDTIAQLSRPASKEAFQVMERNIIGLLGGLPSQEFDVTITTNRENLGRLLASAMMSGYFLRNAEQRMDLEQAILGEEHS
jgi:Protein of unknown function (DUF760)